jgi:hypothetical protein
VAPADTSKSEPSAIALQVVACTAGVYKLPRYRPIEIVGSVPRY